MAKIPLQVTFDTVVNHLRKQGCRSMALNVGCAYRGRENTKCAAGCLIPDEDYVHGIEGQACNSCTEAGRLIASIGHDIVLVRRLQTIHDSKRVSSWETLWKDLADEFHLTYTPPVPA